jgi:iron complex transport system ATP-binding protein
MSIRLEELGLRRGHRDVLVELDAELEAGRRIALCGPNGAGKSSLLALIAGDLKPSQGRVRLNGQAPASVSAGVLADLRAVLVQQTELAHPFSALQVAGLGGRDGLAQLTELGLDGLADRRYTALSGGEQRLVQLARVLAQLDRASADPAWLLLDEPVSHLDLGMAQRVLDAAGRRAARGRGVIAVLHDLERASRWAERLLVLSGGRLIADGRPAEVLTSELVSRVWDLRARVIPEDAGGIRIRAD